MSQEEKMDTATIEKTNGSQFAGITLPPDADFDKLRQFVHDLARQEFDAAGGERKEAHEALMTIVEVRPDVAAALQGVAYHELWHHYLTKCSADQRDRIKTKLRHNNDGEPWVVPDNIGEGLASKRQNMDTIYDYQFPCLGKNIGLATKAEFAFALGKVEGRRDADNKLIDLGKAIQKRIVKGGKDALIQDIVPAEELARLFRQSGVVT